MCLDILNSLAGRLDHKMTMMYYSPGPMMWVTPLSAFSPTPVPPTAMYYTIPQYYLPQAAQMQPMPYGFPFACGTPVTYDPCCAQVPAPSPPRGEYRMGRCLVIC